MRKTVLILVAAVLGATFGFADLSDYGFRPMRQKIYYKEDWYGIYNEWLYSDFDSKTRNIFFLEYGTIAPYDHPVKALCPITNDLQYEKYQYLLQMDICRLLTKSYIDLANYYMKERVLFYNTEYLSNYLDGFDIAEAYYNYARKYWDMTVENAQGADNYKGVYVNDGEYYGSPKAWEDTVYKIKTGQLDYYKVVNERLTKVSNNRAIVYSMLSNQSK